jgi:hypothetical protein
MPVERVSLSISQFAELLGTEPDRVIAVEKRGPTMVLVLEPQDVTHGANKCGNPATTDRRHGRGEESSGRTQENHRLNGNREEKDAL